MSGGSAQRALSTLARQEELTTTAATTKSAKMLDSYRHLHDLMKQYQLKDLVNVDAASFIQTLQEMQIAGPATTEAIGDKQNQHPMAQQFQWGHRHDFGTFSMQ